MSLQAEKPATREAWKKKVLDAATQVVEPGSWSFTETRLALTLFYFPQHPMVGDLDNIVKPILDALAPTVYVDDSLIDRILIRRFDPDTVHSFPDPSQSLADAIAKQGPTLYVKVEKLSVEVIAV